MKLTFGDVGQIEHALRVEGGGARSEAREILKRAAAWLSEQRDSDVFPIDAGAFSLLCSCARSESDEEIRTLAAGTLRLAERTYKEALETVQFVADFAVSRMEELSQGRIRRASPPLSDADRAEAIALYEAARGDRSFSDDELLECARKFLGSAERDSSIFGRLAADLSFL